MLRKIFVFALTSGLLKKAYDHYRNSHLQEAAAAPRHVAKRRAAQSAAGESMTQPKAPASRRRSGTASA